MNAFQPERRIPSLFKLIAACKHCDQSFKTAAGSTSNPLFRLLANKICQTAQDFQFELAAEARRYGPDEYVSDAAEFATGNDLKSNQFAVKRIEQIIEEYHIVARSSVSAHTRAMLRRQCLFFEQLRTELLLLNRARLNNPENTSIMESSYHR